MSCEPKATRPFPPKKRIFEPPSSPNYALLGASFWGEALGERCKGVQTDSFFWKARKMGPEAPALRIAMYQAGQVYVP